MVDWKRSTREASVGSLPPDTIAAVDKHIELYNIGDVRSRLVACIETTSRKVKKGLFAGGDQTVVTTVLLTPDWLIWAVRGQRSEGAVMSARLADIIVQDYAATPLAKMVPDSGVEVSGAFTDVAERGSAFIGLDDSPAARNFKSALLEAVKAAKT